MTTVVVTGGRDFTDAMRVAEILTGLHIRYRFRLLVHGNGRGLDKLADAWAIRNGVPVRTFNAAWGDLDVPGAVIKQIGGQRPYNANAGPQRNQRMIDESRPDVGVVFPGGQGTNDCHLRMKEYKKSRPTFEIIVVPSFGPLPFRPGPQAFGD